MNDTLPVLDIIRKHMLRFEADALVDAVMLLARNGKLPPGTRLPRINDMTEALGLSTSTISRAWSSLVQMGIIETRRRGGTFIAAPVEATSYRLKGVSRTAFIHHLAPGYPDPNLQVDLKPLLIRVAEEGEFHGYPGKDQISEPLREAVLARIGYTPDRMLLDTEIIGALPRILQALGHRGAAIGIGNPEFALYKSIIKQAGMTPAPITFSRTGYDLVEIESALKSGVRVLLLQTRVQNPTGFLVPTENLAHIANLLKAYDATAIEVDHHGNLAPEAPIRLASLAPEHVILMSAFSKEIHPDIRVSAITGPAMIMERISVWRSGGEWVSAINAKLLEIALTDAHVASTVKQARHEYAARRNIFIQRFATAGIEIHSAAGLCLWIPVRSEEDTVLRLAAQSISVARGSAYLAAKNEGQEHVFLSLGGLRENSEYLSQRILEASLVLPPDMGYFA